MVEHKSSKRKRKRVKNQRKRQEQLVRRLFDREFAPIMRHLVERSQENRQCSTLSISLAQVVASTYTFDRHQVELARSGIKSFFELFEEHFIPIMRHRNVENQRIIQHICQSTDQDLADFFRWQETRIHDQSEGVEAEDLQKQQAVILDGHKDLILESVEWDDKIRGLVGILRRLGRVPNDVTDDDAHDLLRSIVYLDLLERTGPAKPKQDGTPRRMDDVVSLGHLTHRLEGEFHDDAATIAQDPDGGGMEVARVEGEKLVGDDQHNWLAVHSKHNDPRFSAVEHEYDAEKILRQAEEELPPQNLEMLKMWMDGDTQEKIATELGFNQSTVSRYLRSTLESLQKKYSSD